MGFIGSLVKFLLKRLALAGVVVAAIMLMPGLPPYCNFTEINLTPTLPREGVLAPNNALDGIKRILVDKVHGPEAFQVHNGELYTSLLSGEIVKLSPGGHVTFVTKVGQPCDGYWQENKCGRPLGFRIEDSGKFLYVVDAYYGIWKVDLKTDKKQLLVSPRVEVGGRAPMLFNSIALDKNGDFYWTDSSSDFQLRDGTYTTLADPSGRLLHYNAARNESRVLLDGLWFSNGVALAPDGEFVITCECLASRIHRVYLKGPKKGQRDIFVDGLPGVPDNLQPLPDGSGVLVGLYKVFGEEDPMISRSMTRFPLLRRLVARVLRLIEIPFEFLQQQFPHYVFERVIHQIGNFASMASIMPKGSGIIQLDWNGNIVGAFFNQDGTASTISDSIVFQDKLYIGSPTNPFVGILPAPEQLKKAFSKQKSAPEPKKQDAIPKRQEKPVELKPKPAQAPQVKKPAEPMKEVPIEAKPVKQVPKETKPVEAKKPQQEKPKAQAEQKATPPKPVEKKVDPPKPAVQQPKPAVQQPKPTEAPPKATTKPVEQARKVETPKAKVPESTKPAAKDAKKKPEHIPIVENIPVDTAKPTKEPLKVIKREGPAEIPNPEL